MGVSVETRRYAFRLDHLRAGASSGALRQRRAAARARSAASTSTGIHWVIAGGESGPNARPMDYDWVAELRDQCTAAGVAFFFKQWGGRTPKAGGRELDGEFWDELPVKVG